MVLVIEIHSKCLNHLDIALLERSVHLSCSSVISDVEQTWGNIYDRDPELRGGMSREEYINHMMKSYPIK
jgi:hypothetical protein